VNDIAEDEITGYVAEVRLALGGVPEATREELLDDLPEHLTEVLAEGTGSLRDRLGAPSAYAAELLAAAGLAAGEPRKRQAPLIDADEVRERAVHWLRIADVRVGPVLGYERASEFLTLLRPAWWVLRGYLAAMVLATVLDAGSTPIGLLPRVGGSDVMALALLGACVVGSIWLGRRELPDKPWPRYALWSGTALLILISLAGFAGADSTTRQNSEFSPTYSGNSQYDNIQDIFVYDSQGNLVEGAQLYDQNGAALQFGGEYCTDPNTGESWTSWQRGYPRCPKANPFLSPSPTVDEDEVPTPGPSPSLAASAPPAGAPTQNSAPASVAPARNSAMPSAHPSPSAPR
jgi:uncharacterized membrane protein